MSLAEMRGARSLSSCTMNESAEERSPALPLSFRPVEIAALGGATAFVGLVLWHGHSSRPRGFLLIGAYVAVAIGFFAAGDR